MVTIGGANQSAMWLKNGRSSWIENSDYEDLEYTQMVASRPFKESDNSSKLVDSGVVTPSPLVQPWLKWKIAVSENEEVGRLWLTIQCTAIGVIEESDGSVHQALSLFRWSRSVNRQGLSEMAELMKSCGGDDSL